MITVNLDTNELPADMLTQTYVSISEESGGIIRISKCMEIDKEYSNLRVMHPSMYPGSEEQAHASFITGVQDRLVDMGVITGSIEKGQTLHLDKLAESTT